MYHLCRYKIMKESRNELEQPRLGAQRSLLIQIWGNFRLIRLATFSQNSQISPPPSGYDDKSDFRVLRKICWPKCLTLHYLLDDIFEIFTLPISLNNFLPETSNKFRYVSLSEKNFRSRICNAKNNRSTDIFFI